VQLVSYHAYVEYIPDPPDGEAVSVAVWPLSIVNVGTETVRTVLTGIVTTFEVTVTGVSELSVTSNSNDQMPVVNRVSVPDMGPRAHANEGPKSLKLEAPGAFASA
jgi:hypothetical protein